MGEGDSDDDFYSFSLQAGQYATIALAMLDEGDGQIALLQSDGAVLATGQIGAKNVDQLIRGFVPDVEGTYYVRVTASEGALYNLLVTRGADFDREENSTANDAQDLSEVKQVLGHLSDSSLSGGGGATVSLGLNLFDVHGFRWDIQRDGNISDGTSDAYDGGLRFTGGVSFPSFTTGLSEDNGREIAIGPATFAGVRVTRKIYVPTNQGFARFLEVVTNTTSSTVNFTVPINTNLGSDGGEQFIRSSSGDNIVTTADDWVITDDGDGFNDPTLIHLVAGPGGIRPSQFLYRPGEVLYSYPLTLAPGETQIVMHFASQNSNRAQALAKAPLLAALELDALAGMSSAERGLVVNFDAGSPEDHYTFTAEENNQLILRTSTPGVAPGEPVNLLDPIIDLYGPSGTLLATNDNGAADGRNALLTYTVPAGAGGVYRAIVRGGQDPGEYVLRIEGATGAPQPFTVSQTSPADGSLLAGFPSVFRVDFSHPFLLTSLDAADLAINGSPATGVTIIDGDTAEFQVASLNTGDGVYNVAIADGAVTSLGGQPLAAFASSFDADSTNPRVIASSLGNEATVPRGDLSIEVQFSETLAVNVAVGGLRGEYYLPGGDVVNFPNFDSLTPVHTRIDANIDYPSVNADFAGFTDLDDQFAVRWSGLINIATAGNVVFYLNSDDGSRLFVNDQLVVDNSGLHAMQERSGAVNLTAGLHAVRIEFHERTGGAGVIFSYDPVDGDKQVVPSSVLFVEASQLGAEDVRLINRSSGATVPRLQTASAMIRRQALRRSSTTT